MTWSFRTDWLRTTNPYRGLPPETNFAPDLPDGPRDLVASPPEGRLLPDRRPALAATWQAGPGSPARPGWTSPQPSPGLSQHHLAWWSTIALLSLPCALSPRARAKLPFGPKTLVQRPSEPFKVEIVGSDPRVANLQSGQGQVSGFWTWAATWVSASPGPCRDRAHDHHQVRRIINGAVRHPGPQRTAPVPGSSVH
jgi:hypothetical protein